MIDKIKQNRQAIKPDWKELYHLDTPRKQKKDKPERFIEPAKGKRIDLLNVFPNIEDFSLEEAIASRRSLRKYAKTPLTFEEVSYLLWYTARVDYINNDIIYKTIPTAGASNSGEVYLYINNVETIDPGVYLYLQNKHQLVLINQEEDIKDKANQALLKQLRGAGLIFYFTHVLPRVEYKYAHFGPKLATLEAGHACQNLLLAAEAIGGGACAIAAYDQKLTDELLKINGQDHFTIYCATLGKKELANENAR